jgi:hypothetical protein
LKIIPPSFKPKSTLLPIINSIFSTSSITNSFSNSNSLCPILHTKILSITPITIPTLKIILTLTNLSSNYLQPHTPILPNIPTLLNPSTLLKTIIHLKISSTLYTLTNNPTPHKKTDNSPRIICFLQLLPIVYINIISISHIINIFIFYAPIFATVTYCIL